MGNAELWAGVLAVAPSSQGICPGSRRRKSNVITCHWGGRARGELFHLGSKQEHSGIRSTGNGTSWVATPRLRGNSLSCKVSSHLPCLYAKHSEGAMHTWCYLMFEKIVAKRQQPTLLASTSFCPEGRDSLRSNYLGLDTAEQAATVLAAGG